MKFRKKPIVVDAIRFTGSNWGEVETFVPVGRYNDDGTFSIVTREGEMKCDIGDYVIKEPFATEDRKFYPCKPDIFEKTYEPVFDESQAYGNDCPNGRCEG